MVNENLGSNTTLVDSPGSASTDIVSSPAYLTGYFIRNEGSTSVSILFYDKASPVIPASDVPRFKMRLSAGSDGANLAMSSFSAIKFLSGIQVRCIQDFNHTGTTEPESDSLTVNILTKA